MRAFVSILLLSCDLYAFLTETKVDVLSKDSKLNKKQYTFKVDSYIITNFIKGRQFYMHNSSYPDK